MSSAPNSCKGPGTYSIRLVPFTQLGVVAFYILNSEGDDYVDFASAFEGVVDPTDRNAVRTKE